jgi:rhodanese-related sulfurtransferase
LVSYRSISPSEAAALIEHRDDVVILDVRTPHEYEQLGHIPGAWLLPVDLIASAPALLPEDGREVLVYCEHGVRSVAAAQWLVAAGIPNIVNMSGGMSRWSGPREHDAGRVRGPAGWLLENADLLPRGGRVLDVAAGRGRHALLLGAAGFSVHAIDRDESALAGIAKIATVMELDVSTEVLDLEPANLLEASRPANPRASIITEGRGSTEGRGFSLGQHSYDAILVFNYLYRPLMPTLREALKPGGMLFYETFLVGQAERGHPKNPAFLLQPGELAELVAPLTIVRSREGDVDGNLVASVVARSEAQPR